MYRALLVEDDKDLSHITKINLIHADYEVDTAFSCGEALFHLKDNE